MTESEEAAMRRELGSMRVRDLRALAREEGVCLGYQGSRKADVVEAIVSARRYRDYVEHEGAVL